MKLARVIPFTAQMDAMSAFSRDGLRLKQVTNEKGWREFAAGGTRIAPHSGPASPGCKGPKIVFFAKDVAAARAKLATPRRPLRQGPSVREPRPLRRRGPGRNPLQLRNR